MTANEKITWLGAFISLWNKAHDEQEQNILLELYVVFCDSEQLPAQSAEENLFDLIQ